MASPAVDAPMTSMNTTGLLPPPAAPAGLFAGAPLSSWLLTVFVGYALLCQALRFRREKALRAKYGYPDRASLKNMTTEHAQAIVADMYQLEFPQFAVMSLQFGLFKTYGVETISRLLLATRNLTDPVNSLKRYEDTAVMIGEFSSNPPNSARALAAIARMNYLHSKYVAAGQISNADLLYTLSVFVTEPARFMRLFEWRPLNDMEHCAYGAFWKSIGDAMGIQYDGYLERPGRWVDGLDFAEDITAWAKRYEVTAFVPSMTSHQPAVALIPMITYWVPAFAKPFAEECVTVLLGDRVREAFVLPEPGLVASTVTYTALLARRFFLRHLALPRFAPLRRHHPRGCESPDRVDAPIYTSESYGNYPFYVRPTVWNRWLSPLAWGLRLKGGKLPGDDPAEYMTQGFRFDELGPRARMGQGKAEMDRDVARMRERDGGRGMGGCPFG